MKRALAALLAICLVAGGAAAYHFYPRDPGVTIQVSGMVCEGCVEHVSTSLAALPGVKDVTVSLANQVATIHYRDGAQPDHDALVKAIVDAGYQAK